MRSLVLAIFISGVCCNGNDVPADFECQTEECHSDLGEVEREMYLIQKKLEVGLDDQHFIALSTNTQEELYRGDDCKDNDDMLKSACTANPPMCENHTDLTCAELSGAGKCDKVKGMSVCDKSCKFCDSSTDSDSGSAGGEGDKTAAASGGKSDAGANKSDEGAGDSGNSTEGGNVTGGNVTGANSSSANSSLWDWTFVPWPWSSERYHSNHTLAANAYHDWDVYVMTHIMTWLLWVMLALLIWHFCFPGEPEIFRESKDPRYVFEVEHFSCAQTPRICCCSFCCPAIQWSDTMHLAGFAKVWVALPLFFFAALLNGFVYGTFWTGIFTSLLIIHFRQHLRHKLGLKAWTCPNCCFDCVYVCLCPCCAVAQEAQVTRYAYLQNSQVAYPATQPTIYTTQRSLRSLSPANSAPRLIATPSTVVTSSRVSYTRSRSPARVVR